MTSPRFATIATLAAILMMASNAFAADPIVGKWLSEEGTTMSITACGASVCVKAENGEHAGKAVGRLDAAGAGRYRGTLIDPRVNKSYTGKAVLNGGLLTMSGCVLGGLICQGQTWTRK